MYTEVLLITWVLLPIANGTRVTGCPDGWVSYGRKCYYFSTVSVNWVAAFISCRVDLGGQLVEIEDAAENDFLKEKGLQSNRSYWIGLSDAYVEGSWVWVTSRKNISFSKAFSDWHPGDPDNVDLYSLETPANCAYILRPPYYSESSEFHWIDSECQSLVNFICEKEKRYVDCLEILEDNPAATDGVYTVSTWSTKKTIQVLCDMTTDGGVWTVMQKRFDGSVDFARNFSQYENGFGDLNSEFWLGLKYAQEMVSQNSSTLRIDVEIGDGSKAFETFADFTLAPGPGYTIGLGATIDSLNVTAGVASNHTGMKFSTFDHDVDNVRCVGYNTGGWWFTTHTTYPFLCYVVYLNGYYQTPGGFAILGMPYVGTNVYMTFTYNQTLKTSKMMFRRV